MNEIKPVERFTFSVDHEIVHQDELGIWVKFSDYEALQKENEAQAKRIAELEDAVKINHEWHKKHDDWGGYMGSALCNKNTSVLTPLQPLMGRNGGII